MTTTTITTTTTTTITWKREKDRDKKNQFEEHPNSIYLIILLKGTSG
jgi:hypothetical protein